MSDPNRLEDDLIQFLGQATGLSPAVTARIVEEVTASLDELPEEFVCRRHRELQRDGCPNSEIFARIADEMARRRFRAPAYSARQIRRMIYG